MAHRERDPGRQPRPGSYQMDHRGSFETPNSLVGPHWSGDRVSVHTIGGHFDAAAAAATPPLPHSEGADDYPAGGSLKFFTDVHHLKAKHCR